MKQVILHTTYSFNKRGTIAFFFRSKHTQTQERGKMIPIQRRVQTPLKNQDNF